MKTYANLILAVALMLAPAHQVAALCVDMQKSLLDAKVINCEPATRYLVDAMERKDHQYGEWRPVGDDVDATLLEESATAVVLTLVVTAERIKTWDFNYRRDRPKKIRVVDSVTVPRVEQFWRPIEGLQSCRDFPRGLAVQFVAVKPCSCEIEAAEVTGHRKALDVWSWEYPEKGFQNEEIADQ